MVMLTSIVATALRLVKLAVEDLVMDLVKPLARWILRDQIAFLKKEHDRAALRAHTIEMIHARSLRKIECYETIRRCFKDPSQVKKMGFKTLEDVVSFEVNREESP